MTLGSENCLLAVDEEVAFAARSERHFLTFERALPEEGNQTRTRIAHRARLRRAARAPFFSAGTTGGGGPGRSSVAAGAGRGGPFLTTAGALRASGRAAGLASRAAAVRARPFCASPAWPVCTLPRRSAPSEMPMDAPLRSPTTRAPSSRRTPS